eukprot:353179-Chlamydomonas_euryale.AAC.1
MFQATIMSSELRSYECASASFCDTDHPSAVPSGVAMGAAAAAARPALLAAGAAPLPRGVEPSRPPHGAASHMAAAAAVGAPLLAPHGASGQAMKHEPGAGAAAGISGGRNSDGAAVLRPRPSGTSGSERSDQLRVASPHASSSPSPACGPSPAPGGDLDDGVRRGGGAGCGGGSGAGGGSNAVVGAAAAAADDAGAL